MKVHKKSTITRLVARFDNELRTLLLNDLNNVRGIKRQVTRSNAQMRISVA